MGVFFVESGGKREGSGWRSAVGGGSVSNGLENLRDRILEILIMPSLDLENIREGAALLDERSQLLRHDRWG